MAMVVAFAMASALCAAQCEGNTQKGERCKRDAAEGSKFCIGHADQAKKPEAKKPEVKKEAAAKTVAKKESEAKKEAAAKPAAKKETEAKADAKKPKVDAKNAEVKELDDGTCWAVTEAGTRCKHKKDGDKDYCKQHAADVKLAKPVEQCRAMTYSGTQCTRKPEDGRRYCKQHLGK